MTTGTDFHVGIVGLGSMGMGAARSCLRAGLSTWGADLNPQACANLLAEGACGAAASAREFAGVVDALVILVVNAAQVRQVLFGEDGVAHLMKPGSAVMVSSTISSADAQEIAAALTALNLNMLDAPVSGGAVKAAQGEMTVMASGSEAAFDPPEACAGRRCQQRLSHQRYAGRRLNRQNHSSTAGWRAYCGGGRSDGAGRAGRYSSGRDV